MSTKAIWLHNLRGERRLTRETIAALADGDVEFKPVSEQMSFGAQALHVISCQETLLDAYSDRGWKWDRGTDLEHFPSLNAILKRFDAMQAAELALYDDLEPEQLLRLVPTPWGPPEPMIQLAYSFLTHEAHHRGQLVVYLRLKGYTPPRY